MVYIKKENKNCNKKKIKYRNIHLFSSTTFCTSQEALKEKIWFLKNSFFSIQPR